MNCGSMMAVESLCSLENLTTCNDATAKPYGLLLAGSCGTALYWARSSLVTLILSSCYITICSIASTALVGAVVAMFPTSMRTMVVSLTMMFGRTGSIIGNVVFPYLMALGCLPPFVMIGAIVIGKL
uniref:Major facilitator superfamily (MFS) profile domain-containing protein n=1 Tax=Anopheles maculatus TaxID=74869 RepID=A0A182S6T5_9DIPT